MNRQRHDLIPNSPEHHAFRATHTGASEAAAMLGLSKHTTRDELLWMKKTGAAKEFSEWVRSMRLAEATLRVDPFEGSEQGWADRRTYTRDERGLIP